jgi:hypothetical protein
MIDDTARGAQFFEAIKVPLSGDGCELLGVLLRVSATGMDVAPGEPAGHLALRESINSLHEAALAAGTADKPWLSAELMLAAAILKGIGGELAKKFYSDVIATAKRAN